GGASSGRLRGAGALAVAVRVELLAQDAVRDDVLVAVPLPGVTPQEALAAHAELLEHAPAGGVAPEVVGDDLVELERLEAQAEHGRGRFGGVALAPVRDADPEAELGAVVGVVAVEADAADERGGLGAQHDGHRELGPALVPVLDEPHERAG